MIYPKELNPKPDETEVIGNIQIPKCNIKFDKWTGEPLKKTFGDKPTVNIDNKPMFAELAIVELFKMSGWQGRWIVPYGKPRNSPDFLSEWKDDKEKQVPNPITDKRILKVLETIMRYNNNSYSGCWDVIGWNDKEFIFAEAKRLKKDKIRPTQEKWLSNGLKSGLLKDNFMIVEWDM